MYRLFHLLKEMQLPLWWVNKVNSYTTPIISGKVLEYKYIGYMHYVKCRQQHNEIYSHDPGHLFVKAWSAEATMFNIDKPTVL